MMPWRALLIHLTLHCGPIPHFDLSYWAAEKLAHPLQAGRSFRSSTRPSLLTLCSELPSNRVRASV